ncbi:5-oxoprolinase subunit PxpA [Curtobacterium sp. MCBD17_035]|uniref:LamB/YcsF family protein n=1 Tax=Curtobacterium sp. MCBD17_035 TaxID=2175673 RepID=UPI000DA87A54|nr:5-oxoprolinase subunit PxpA [Curtobacterium sp. MCBD17_035]WIB68123.1 5-oxoprolinase subunit PxpA [Curtobacterium sp. MCBD17_035]
MTTIDLNADLGEGFGRWTLGDDAAMLDVVTSANVACGFHAGDPLSLRSVLEQAAERQVSVGAHVAYRDLAGFGRRYVDASLHELAADVIYQIGALAALARAAGTTVRYVKPHGALYNTIAEGGPHAEAVVQAVLAVDPGLPVVGLAGSAFLDLARDAGLPVVAEAFADRAYAADGSLVSRRLPGAVLHDPTEIAERVVGMVTSGAVTAVDGTSVPIDAASICLHGDSPGAVAAALAVRSALGSAGVVLAPFAAVRAA